MRRLLVSALLGLLSFSGLAFADGKATYDKSCASCHGADGRGNADKAKILKIDLATLDLGRPETATATREQLKEIVLKGKAKMPGYEKKLAAADVDPVVDHAMQLGAAARGAK